LEIMEPQASRRYERIACHWASGRGGGVTSSVS
jgi:hypothetical protein